jgi:hypothetical protein
MYTYFLFDYPVRLPLSTYQNRRPSHVGFVVDKVELGQVLSAPANLHSICFSTITFTITRGWHNRSGVAAVTIASQTK